MMAREAGCFNEKCGKSRCMANISPIYKKNDDDDGGESDKTSLSISAFSAECQRRELLSEPSDALGRLDGDAWET